MQQTAPEKTLQSVEHPAEPNLLTTAIKELSRALEEINVISEELCEQHEQLEVAQDTLNRERQEYFDLFELAPDGYLLTNEKAIIQYVNAAAATLFNRPQPQLFGKPLAALIAQSDLRKFYTLLNRLQAGEVIKNIGFYLQPAQDLPIYAVFTISAVRDKQSRVTGFRWLFRDLTQQRTMAAALTGREAQYRAIVEDQSELICRSMPDSRILFVNHAFCQYFGQDSASLISQNLFELILEADHDTVMRQLADLDQAHPTVTLVHRVRFPGGQIRWLEWIHRALFDHKGKFFQFQSVGRDITARKQAEQALQQREIQIQAITEALPILIAYVNEKQQFVYSNHAFEPWLERPNRDIIGHSLWDVLGQERYQQARIPIEEALSGKKTTFEQEISRPGRDPIWLQATLIPDQLGAGEIKGFFLMMIDISHQKAVDYEKAQFMSMVSHEIRTPLTAVHAALAMLTAPQGGPPDLTDQELLEVASTSSQRLVSLVNDLLDFQQMRLGKMPYDPHHCQATDLIESAVDSFKMMAHDHHITLSTRPCQLQVWVDPDRIVQVLTNLISNAIKFSPRGRTVWITAKQITHQRVPSLTPHIKFQVRDQGEGIPDDQRERIFEPFHQVDASYSRRKEGTGLGLAICQRIIEQHRGNLAVDSQVGHGTTISFTLPISKRASEESS